MLGRVKRSVLLTAAVEDLDPDGVSAQGSCPEPILQWWIALNKLHNIRLLDKVRRSAAICITVALRTTLTMAFYTALFAKQIAKFTFCSLLYIVACFRRTWWPSTGVPFTRISIFSAGQVAIGSLPNVVNNSRVVRELFERVVRSRL